MISLVMAIAAAATAAQAAPAATPRTLENLPGVAVHYFDITGTTGAAIQSSFQRAVKAQPKTAGQLFTWTATASVDQQTQGSACTIASAKAVLDANVYLPRLTDEGRVPAPDLKRWKDYEAGLRKTATDNLWFVADKLPTVERSLVGKPCDQAATLWNTGITQVIEQQQEFDRTHKPAPVSRSEDFKPVI